MLLQSYKFFVPLLRFFQEIFNSPENMKQILTTLLLVIAFAITAQAKSEPVKAYFALEPQITTQNLENKVKTGMRYEPGVQATATESARDFRQPDREAGNVFSGFSLLLSERAADGPDPTGG